MIIRQLQLKNYKQYTELDLEFKTGLVGIIGRNGAGKSTIFDAILYCLFGRDEDKKETIRSTYATNEKENISLELSFEIGDALYVVKREFKGKALTTRANLYRNDQHIATDSDVNTEIVKLLKLDKDAFKRSVFSGQKEIGELSAATGEERKKMVRKILGLDKLEKIHQTIKEDANGLKKEIKGQRENLLSEERKASIHQEMSVHNERIAQINIQKVDIVAQLKLEQEAETSTKISFEAEEQKLKVKNALDLELTKYSELSKNLTEQISTIEKELEDLEQLAKRCQEQLPEIQRLELQKKELEQARETAIRYESQKKYKELILGEEKNLTANKAAQKEFSASLSEQKILDIAIIELTKNVEERKSTLDALSALILHADKKLSEIDGQIQDRKKKIQQLETLGKDADCPTCFQPLKERYESTIQHFNEEIDRFQKESYDKWSSEKQDKTKEFNEISSQIISFSDTLQQKKDTLIRLQEIEKAFIIKQTEHQQISARLQEYNSKLEELGTIQFDPSSYAELEIAVKNVAPILQQYHTDQSRITEDIPKKKAEKEQLSQRISKGNKLIEEKMASLEKLNFSEEYYEQLKEKKEILNKSIRTLSAAENELIIKIKDEENKIYHLNTLLSIDQKTQLQIADKENEITLLEKLSNYFGEFKTSILERITPTISHEASQLFSQITKGRYDKITVDEKYEFQVVDVGNIYPLSRFSGGEIDLANLCLRIALTKAIGELSGSVPLNFLAFDEVFGSQDEERRQGIMYALELLQEQFKQIYIISHIDSINDFFPNILKVSLEEKGSVARWVEG